jgi:hypothetical protein
MVRDEGGLLVGYVYADIAGRAGAAAVAVVADAAVQLRETASGPAPRLAGGVRPKASRRLK